MRAMATVWGIILLAISAFLYIQYDVESLNKTGKLSKASKAELWNSMALSHVIGGYAVKTQFARDESPILWLGSYNSDILKIAVKVMKNGGTFNVGSEDFKNNDKDSQKIVEAMHKGQITCDSIQNASVSQMVPELTQHVRSMCFAPLPAFDPDFKQIVVFLLDVPLDDLNIPEIRKQILQVQINVHNREYLGQETWAQGLARQSEPDLTDIFKDPYKVK